MPRVVVAVEESPANAPVPVEEMRSVPPVLIDVVAFNMSALMVPVATTLVRVVLPVTVRLPVTVVVAREAAPADPMRSTPDVRREVVAFTMSAEIVPVAVRFAVVRFESPEIVVT